MEEKASDTVKTENPETEKALPPNVKIDQYKDKKKYKDANKSNAKFLKSLKNIESKDEQISQLLCKNAELAGENHALRWGLSEMQDKVNQLQREKQQYQSERSKAILTKKRLESLCRELQKQNKAVKEESLSRMKEEEEKMKEVSAKFQNTLSEISTLMNQSIEKNAKMHEDNVEMNKRYKFLYEQIELKEQQLQAVHQQMKNDLQMVHSQLAQVKKAATEEKEAILKDKHQLLCKLTEYQTQIKELQATEVGLRGQISIYTDKYEEFQNALTRSNKVYGEFNEEMERMSKKILALEKETALWKQRFQKSHTALLDMASEKQVNDKEIATLNKKVSLLQDLCKMFQRERSSLLDQLAEKNGTPRESSKVNNQTTEPPPTEAQIAFQMMQIGKAIERDIRRNMKNDKSVEDTAENSNTDVLEKTDQQNNEDNSTKVLSNEKIEDPQQLIENSINTELEEKQCISERKSTKAEDQQIQLTEETPNQVPTNSSELVVKTETFCTNITEKSDQTHDTNLVTNLEQLNENKELNPDALKTANVKTDLNDKSNRESSDSSSVEVHDKDINLVKDVEKNSINNTISNENSTQNYASDSITQNSKESQSNNINHVEHEKISPVGKTNDEVNENEKSVIQIENCVVNREN